MKYDTIEWAGVKRCSPGVAVEQQLTIAPSALLGVSGRFVRGRRDTPEFVTRSGYSMQIEAARDICVMLYDVTSRRGWLVDGAGALLHMVRTRLTREPYHSINGVSYFNNPNINPTYFKHPSITGGPDEAAQILKDECNLKHIVLREFDSYVHRDQERREVYKTTCVRELVSQTWSK